MIAKAPVAVFAYRRPDHLRNTLQSLMNCSGFAGTPVIVFCDGKKGDGDAAAVEATRTVARELLGNLAEFRFAEANRGLARSIIDGVTETVNRYGRVIVVEDDLQLNAEFLNYMNASLDRFEDADQVFQVSGYSFSTNKPASGQAQFFPFIVSWGWGTWKRAWDRFDPASKGWEALREDAALRRRFNLGGAYDYASMLFRQMAGRGDSWAIRWYWTVFSQGGLVLFPPVTLVSNTGFDGSGTHGRGAMRQFSAGTSAGAGLTIMLPEKAQVDDDEFRAIRRDIRRRNGGPIGVLIDWARRTFRS